MTYKGKRVLITGGTGSWGHELTQQLLDRGVEEIRLFSRNELSQVLTARKFQDTVVKCIIGDVRDSEAVSRAACGVDYIFHLAALKHVPLCESYPYEAIQTNINGSKNVIEAALKQQVPNVVFVSTDKAVAPYNLYGMTKGVAEKLFSHANSLGDTTFVCIRGGNVLGSNGSVVPSWINQIQQSNSITITDPEMTRFYLTLSQAISLIFVAIEGAAGGELFVMKMPACRLCDLGEVLVEKYGNKDTKIKIVGARPGEKIHECLISTEESINSHQLSEDYYVVLPLQPDPALIKYYDHLPKNLTSAFSSSDKLMSKEEIATMLVRGGF